MKSNICIVIPSFPTAHSRNIRAQKCSLDDILVFMDGDVMIPKKRLERFVSEVGLGSFLCLGNHPVECNSRLIIIHKSDFIKTGGFNTHLLFGYGPEDFDWGQRALKCGLKKIMYPADSVYHKPHSKRLFLNFLTWFNSSYLLLKYKYIYLAPYGISPLVWWLKRKNPLVFIAKTLGLCYYAIRRF